MKRSIQVIVVGVVVLLFACAMSGLAQVKAPGSPHPVTGSSVQSGSPRIPSSGGTLYIPKSSLPQAVPAGHNFVAHTNIEVYVPDSFTPETAPPYNGYGYETPQSLECHYALTSNGANYPNCNPNASLNTATVGSQSIAIVDAYDDPVAGSDLAWFSLQFGLQFSIPQFERVWANTGESSCPVNYGYGVGWDYSGGWEIEESLDIEWAHAMAPGAKIYLVEACSDYDFDLQQAVLVANNLVQCGNSELNQSTGVLGTCPSVTGKGEVSMSWGGGEFSGETTYDTNFLGAGSNIVYFAASGDGPGVIYPSASPDVVAVGGTTNRRNAATFNWEGESAWVFGGGGVSAFEPIPSYQTGIGNCLALSTTNRCVPDVSSDADPYTGVWVYDTFGVDFISGGDWWIVGGTSVATPTWAGIVNNAETGSGSFAGSTAAELTTLYNNRKVATDFTDITTGFCGPYMGLSAATYWDPCTGIGVPYSFAGK